MEEPEGRRKGGREGGTGRGVDEHDCENILTPYEEQAATDSGLN